MFVDSNPKRFYIYINGRNTGQLTPDTINWLPLKNYNVILKQNLWRDTSFVLHSDTAEVPGMFVDQLANPKMYGSIKFRSNPNNSNILLNDTLLNQKTPFIKTRLIPGYYKVKFTKPEHRHVEQTVTVRSNDTTEIYASLQDTSLWVDYNTRNSNIKYDYLDYVAVDKNDIKWIATNAYGVIKFIGDEYEYITEFNSELPSNIVNQIIVDKENRKWFCTNGGLAIYDDNSWEIINKNNSELTSNNILNVKFDDDGNTWICTGIGLIRKNQNTWKNFYIISEIDSVLTILNSSFVDVEVINSSFMLVGEKTTGLWIFNQFSKDTTYYGFNKYFTNLWYPKYNLPSKSIQTLEKDHKGYIWTIHDYKYVRHPYFQDISIGGFSILNPIDTSFTIQRFVTPDNHLESIYIDLGNNTWFPSKAGLYLFTDEAGKTLFNFASSKLPFAHLTSIAQESSGLMWCTSKGGGLIKFKYYQ